MKRRNAKPGRLSRPKAARLEAAVNAEMERRVDAVYCRGRARVREEAMRERHQFDMERASFAKAVAHAERHKVLREMAEGFKEALASTGTDGRHYLVALPAMPLVGWPPMGGADRPQCTFSMDRNAVIALWGFFASMFNKAPGRFLMQGPCVSECGPVDNDQFFSVNHA